MRARLFTLVATLFVAGLLLVGLNGGTASAAFPGRNGLIAFTTGPLSGIYVTDVSGSNPTPVDLDARDDAPTWSPDGSKIAFERFGVDGGIYVMNADGSDVRRLSYAPADSASDSGATWSPDGTKIAFTRDSVNTGIYVVNADGSDMRRLTHPPTPNQRATDWGLAWSPDGTKIAFTRGTWRNAEIYVMNADGSDLRDVSNNPAADAHPAWSPDGTKIAFTSTREAPLFVPADVWVMNSDGSEPQRLSDSPANCGSGRPFWSPDGSKIAFGRLCNGSGDEIDLMNADGSGESWLEGGGGAISTFVSWSPDGSEILFEQGCHHGGCPYLVWVMHADGSGVRPLTSSPNSSGSPDWQPLPPPPPSPLLAPKGS